MAIVRRLYKESKYCEPEVVCIVGRVAIGATGAVGTATGKGFTVTRTGAGLYTITPDSSGAVPNILACFADVIFATAGNTQTAKVLTLAPSTPAVTLQCNDAGTVDVAADPPSGSVLQFVMWVRNLDANN